MTTAVEHVLHLSRHAVPPLLWTAPASAPIVAIAASAGGIQALSCILGGLPEDFPGIVVVALHRSSGVRSRLTDILSRVSRLPIVDARENGMLEPSTIVIPPPGFHILIESGGRIRLQLRDREPVCPSADLLFGSIGASGSARHLGVILTGSGIDGAMGSRALGAVGAMVIAQDEHSAEFPQMPRAAREI